MNHVFQPDAVTEFEQAARFYRKCGRMISDWLVAEVRAAIRRVLMTPTRWRILEGDVRRCLVRVFPYSVLYND